MNINSKYVSYRGLAVTDLEILAKIPADLRYLLTEINGCIMFDGGLHIRGACVEPEWHSLRKLWEGEMALHLLYPNVRIDDVPFGEDCLGDQFLIRNRIVHRLSAETGEISSLEISLAVFLEEAQKNPVEFLSLHPLLKFQHDKGCSIKPGELLASWPLFCMAEAGTGVELWAVPALKHISFLAHVADKISKVPDGGKVEIKFVD